MVLDNPGETKVLQDRRGRRHLTSADLRRRGFGPGVKIDVALSNDFGTKA